MRGERDTSWGLQEVVEMDNVVLKWLYSVPENKMSVQEGPEKKLMQGQG